MREQAEETWWQEEKTSEFKNPPVTFPVHICHELGQVVHFEDETDFYVHPRSLRENFAIPDSVTDEQIRLCLELMEVI